VSKLLLNIGGMMKYGHEGYGWGWTIFGSIFMILFWLAVILLIIWLYKQIKGPTVAPQTETALELLKTRYAKGAIDKKEFEEKKKDLH
jgi:putative membrane protein